MVVVILKMVKLLLQQQLNTIETVLEQSVPINHVASVEKFDAAPPAEEKETKDGMKKPTVVARGSLVQ